MGAEGDRSHLTLIVNNGEKPRSAGSHNEEDHGLYLLCRNELVPVSNNSAAELLFVADLLEESAHRLVRSMRAAAEHGVAARMGLGRETGEHQMIVDDVSNVVRLLLNQEQGMSSDDGIS